MKKLHLSFIMSFLFLLGYCQRTTVQQLDDILLSMKTFESGYNCIKTPVQDAYVVSKVTFDSIYFLSSSRILTSSQDFVKNGKAAVLDFSEPVKRLTINYSWKKNEISKTGSIWTAGLIAEEASKKLFEIFGKKGWKEGFTFNIGQAIPKKGYTILFMPTPCAALKDKREVYYTELLRDYATILATPSATIVALQARQAAIVAYTTSHTFSTLPNAAAAPIPLTDNEKKLLEKWNALEKLENSLRQQANYETLYLKPVADFEVANFKEFGYKVNWFNWNISGGLKRFTIYDTAVVSLASLTRKSLARFSGTFSYNHFIEAADNKSITYTSAEIAAGNTNYLEEILPSEITQLKSLSGTTEIKEDYDALVVKDYQKLKKTYAYISLGGVFNYFPGKIGKIKERFLGFELAASTKVKVFVPSGVAARDLFSIRGGFLFTFEKDKIAKTTFGIIASLTDIPYNDLTVKNRFGIGIRIGVPFNY